MQDLVIGGMYKASHPNGYWSGECIVTKIGYDGAVFYRDMRVVQRGELGEGTVSFLEGEWDRLYGFNFEPIHVELENK